MSRRSFIRKASIFPAMLFVPGSILTIQHSKDMKQENNYEVIIIGGSYAGLSAAMALGRAMRKVLIIDGGKACNRTAPHSHNFLTHDGKNPARIAAEAREEVLSYPTVKLLKGEVVAVSGQDKQFTVNTSQGEVFGTGKILFATGVKDEMLPIPGFAESWGISVIHCPYCHGYEVRNERTVIIANGEMAFEFARLIHNWTDKLAVFTNGVSTLDPEKSNLLKSRNIEIVQTAIQEIIHEDGQVKQLLLQDGSIYPVRAIYARLPFIQHCEIPEKLGCELTEQGHIRTNDFRQTNVPGIYAAGDNTTPMRSVSSAVAAGTTAGAIINHTLVQENF